MRDQIDKYTAKLCADRSALPEAIAFAVKDDILFSVGEGSLALLAEDILNRLNALSVTAIKPSLPFADFLARRMSENSDRIIPRDTETRTFLHDIPVIRQEVATNELAELVAQSLSTRKGVIVEGVGIFAVGPLTVEQAYINFSSVFHATFVKYLQDILREGFAFAGEEVMFDQFRREWLRPLTMDGLSFRQGPITDSSAIVGEIATVGRYTVRCGLVDSFFGNISLRHGDTIYISQTAASLDELEGCIDPVPMDNSSTTGITASSELLAHRKIYEASDALTVLHGHPRFSVVMSMECEEAGCQVEDCWKECPTVRYLGDCPVVAGEIGAGGLAKRVPPVIALKGRAIVYGHGVFTTGSKDFAEAFRAMISVENFCREEFFRRLDRRAQVD
jgi:ribulose-5-phosphate 4-epimerase/fuculose-1-phosphate aldolase